MRRSAGPYAGVGRPQKITHPCELVHSRIALSLVTLSRAEGCNGPARMWRRPCLLVKAAAPAPLALIARVFLLLRRRIFPVLPLPDHQWHHLRQPDGGFPPRCRQSWPPDLDLLSVFCRRPTAPGRTHRLVRPTACPERAPAVRRRGRRRFRVGGIAADPSAGARPDRPWRIRRAHGGPEGAGPVGAEGQDRAPQRLLPSCSAASAPLRPQNRSSWC